jgi:hypothetical protein
MSLVVGATPGDEVTEAMIDYDIAALAESPFGKSSEGRAIVKLLRSQNRGGNVVYGKIENESRGDWDGHTIRVNEDSRGKVFRTILELVHEASHALWRKNHAVQKNDKKRRADDVADELHAQENQLLVYRYLKEKKGCPEDAELEARLARQAKGTLQRSIEEGFEESKARDQGSP